MKGVFGPCFELGTVVHLFDMLAIRLARVCEPEVRPMLSRRSTLSAQLMRRVAGSLVMAVMASLAIATMPEQAWGESVQAQIDQANEKLEPIIEEYDRVASLLVTDQAKATALGTQGQPGVRPGERRAGPAPAGRHAGVRVRRRSSRSVLVLDSTTTPTLVDRLSVADEIVRRQHKAVGSLIAARDKYRAAKKVLDASVVSLSKRKADLGVEEAHDPGADRRLAAVGKARPADEGPMRASVRCGRFRARTRRSAAPLASP